MFTSTAFNQLPMGFPYPMTQQVAPPIYRSQYTGFNPPMPISFPQTSLSRGQSLPPTSRQYVPSNNVYANKPNRRNGPFPPSASVQQNEQTHKSGSKNKKASKQRNISSSGIVDKGLYSDKEKNNLKNSEDRSRSRSPEINSSLKQNETNNDKSNQEQLTPTIENANANIPESDKAVEAEQQQQPRSEGKKKRKSRSKKKMQNRPEYYEYNSVPFQQPPPFFADLPPHIKVHQQPLYSSYNQVYEESIRRGDVYQKQMKRSTRLPPEAKQKLLPHEDDQKRAYPIVGYIQPPYTPYQPYNARPNFYAPTTPPYNARQPYPNPPPGPTIAADDQKIDRLRNHIHSLEHELHKLQKKLNKATLHNNHETSTKDDDNQMHRRSKREILGSPRQTPVIVEINSTNNNNNGRESTSNKLNRTESNQGNQQEENSAQKSNETSGQNTKSSNTIATPIKSPNQQPLDSKQRSRSNSNQVSEIDGKVPPTPAKSLREETAARLAHAAAAHVQARQQIPPPPPVQQTLVPPPPPPPPTQDQQNRGPVPRLPLNGNINNSNEISQQRRSISNLNVNQSNNNETIDIDEKKHNRSAEKILDAFERFYMKDGKSSTNAVKVKYIPDEKSDNLPRQRNTNNNNRCRSSSRSSLNSTSSTWSSSDDSSSENFDSKPDTFTK